MASGRNDRVAPPAHPEGYVVRFLNNEAAKGWEDFVQAAPNPLWAAWQTLITTPQKPANKSRHHRLKGLLSTLELKGNVFEQWQYEVTAGGRIWFCVDEAKRTVWLKKVSLGHPNETK